MKNEWRSRFDKLRAESEQRIQQLEGERDAAWRVNAKIQREIEGIRKTLRDEFAKEALGGLLASDLNLWEVDDAPSFARTAYQIADALLVEREKPPAK